MNDKYQLNYLPEDTECFKVVGDKAYFQIKGITRHYLFASKRDAEAWRNKRSLENRRSGVYEDFMACDEGGLFCGIKRLKIFQTLSMLPPRPTSLIELYAFNDFYGKKDTICEEEDDILIMLEKNNASREKFSRKIVSIPTTRDRKQKLKQLTDRSNLPESIGELFLNEIKLSTDEANQHLRDNAKFLGLL
jgi:hypothetical protein